MGDRFHVILTDLARAAAAFESQSQILAGEPRGRPALPATGLAALDEALATVMDQLVLLRGGAGAWLGEHGRRLGAVEAGYRELEVNMHELYDDLMPEE